MHGGAAPQARRAGRERLASFVDPALTVLRKAMKSDDVHATLKAARDILDRAGVGAKFDRAEGYSERQMLQVTGGLVQLFMALVPEDGVVSGASVRREFARGVQRLVGELSGEVLDLPPLALPAADRAEEVDLLL